MLDASGTPIEGEHDLTVEFFTAPTGGSSVWSEMESVVLNQGYYSVVLGDELSFPDTLFDNAVWVGVSVDGVEQGGRQPLSSVPYALRAATADTLSDSAAGDLVQRFTAESESLAPGESLDVMHSGGTNFVSVSAWYFDGAVWRDVADANDTTCPACGDGSDGEFRPTRNTSLTGGTYQFTNVIIPGGVEVNVVGSEPLNIQATGVVEIDGQLILDGSDGGQGASGNSPPGSAGAVTVGGSAGGVGGWYSSSGVLAQNGRGLGGGQAGQDSGTSSVGAGGGGGGYSRAGLRGGGSSCCADRCGTRRSWSGGAGGTTHTPSPFTTLVGGSGGAGGGMGTADNGTGGGGGSGGGAVKITAPSIVVDGMIRANGGEGGDSFPGLDGGGGGGGSGGTVWLRAASIDLDQSSIRVWGGGGGSTSVGATCGDPGGGGRGRDGRIQLDGGLLSVNLQGEPVGYGPLNGLPRGTAGASFVTVQLDDNTVRLNNVGEQPFPVKIMVLR